MNIFRCAMMLVSDVVFLVGIVGDAVAMQKKATSTVPQTPPSIRSETSNWWQKLNDSRSGMFRITRAIRP